MILTAKPYGGGIEDGQVVGLDKDGCVICWDAAAEQMYNTGVTPEDFGTMRYHEELVIAYYRKGRIGR